MLTYAPFNIVITLITHADLYPCDHQMPCFNKANCSHTDDIGRGYNCSCSIGYTGENCETDIDECSMEPCLNNGTCLVSLVYFVYMTPLNYIL